jgi:hypothetical protein
MHVLQTQIYLKRPDMSAYSYGFPETKLQFLIGLMNSCSDKVSIPHPFHILLLSQQNIHVIHMSLS